MCRKKNVFYTSNFFKELIKNFPKIMCPLFKTLIKFSNFKTNEGSVNDFKRRQVKKIY